jgi:hypothetical protein
MRHNRKLQNIEELMQRNEVKDAKLSRAEVTAVVLYTGPMVRRQSLGSNDAMRMLTPISFSSSSTTLCFVVGQQKSIRR